MDQISEIERGGQDLSSFAMLLLESEIRDADANTYPTDMVCDGPYQPANSPRGFRNFFRKRHKSVGSGGGLESNHIGNCAGSTKGDVVISSGSKIRNLFGPVQPRSKSEMNSIMMSVSAPKNGCRGDAERTTFSMEVEDQNSNSGDGGYGSVPKSPTYLHNVYKTPERHHMLARRSVSVRDSPIGPGEFLEMYRSRAYSDTRLPDRPQGSLRDRYRRFSASPPFSQNVLNEYCPFEPRQLIIWRDNQNGTKVFRLPSTDEEDGLDIGAFDNSEDLIYLRFLKIHSCYDVIPTSTKLVVLDTQLNVKKAFYALMHNNIRAAPLWDTNRQTFVGMLTISDFIKVLLKFHKTQLSNMEAIEDQTISNWTEILPDYRMRPLVYIEPDATMLDAVRKLCLHKIHRLPVIDPLTGNVIYALTHRRLLRYVYCVFSSLGLTHPSFMSKSLEELHLGTYGNIAVVQPGTSLVIALELFVARRVSSLPVVDHSGKLLGLFTKHHIMNLAAEKTYSQLSETVEKALTSKDIEPVQTCKKFESLAVILEIFVTTEVHRLIIVDDVGRVEGVLSLSDILRYLVLRTPTDSGDLSEKKLPRSSMTVLRPD